MKTITKKNISFTVNAFNGSVWGKIFRAAANSYMSFLTDSFWDNVQNGKWENDTYIIFDTFIDKYHSYIDIGAYYGSTVLYGGQIAKHCYAAEPDPVSNQILSTNISLNPKIAHKITVFNGAIAPKSGQVTLSARLNLGDSMSTIVETVAAQTLQVTALSFMDFIKKYQIHDCNFIKIDTEGAESIILPTMTQYIEKNHPTIHVSFHPVHFPHFTSDSKNIFLVLTLYKHIYNSKGILLNANTVCQLFKKMKNFDVVLTDKNWQIR